MSSDPITIPDNTLVLPEYTLSVLNELNQAGQTASGSLGYQMMLAQQLCDLNHKSRAMLLRPQASSLNHFLNHYKQNRQYPGLRVRRLRIRVVEKCMAA